MEVGDLHKVWEIKALKKPDEDAARRILERVAKQVQPIMRRRRWRVKLLSEFCPAKSSLLGLNMGGGVHVKLRLRRPNGERDFFPYEAVLDTMLHELCHIEHGPHNALFYKLWDEIRKECEELIAKGITGTGRGFDVSGRRLGGVSHQPPLSALRRTALAAAEKRKHIGTLLPSGPRRLGGDVGIKSVLAPVQAAAMAAERRILDEVWCASVSSVQPDAVDVQSNGTDHLSSKRPAETTSRPSTSAKDAPYTIPIDKIEAHGRSSGTSGAFKRLKVDSLSSGPCDVSENGPSGLSNCGTSFDQSFSVGNVVSGATWECHVCTLFNKPLALACEACATERPNDVEAASKIWSCRFCTLDNDVKLEKCSACGQWRYSYGQPVFTCGPNMGT